MTIEEENLELRYLVDMLERLITILESGGKGMSTNEVPERIKYQIRQSKDKLGL